MKKISVLFAIVCIGFFTTIFSCKKDAPLGDRLQLQVYYKGALRDYTVLESLKIQDSTAAVLLGTQGGTINKLTLRIGGVTCGQYKMLWPTDTASYLKIYKGYVTYITKMPGGWGNINMTQFDSTTTWVKGTFDGTVVNTIDPTDSFSVTQGLFEIKYPH